ncbi:bacteriocin-like WGxF protein [Peribacillus muralis]|uniref:bacteriocin-like WGxF protein n=1 Tax=Peribacillus muralis TaxID=264697 RepID=UPI003D03D582
MNHITFALLNCLLIIPTGIIHKVIFRVLSLPYDNIFLYWGAFIGIFFILNIISSLIFRK